MLQAILILF